MGTYGIALYGLSFYGTSTLPTSDPWDIFDFCEPNDSTMLGIMAYPEVSSARTFVSPQYTFNGANDLCLYSNDDLDSGIDIETTVPPTFSMQFTLLPTALPDDFTSLANERFYVVARNQFGYMAGVLLSENGGMALATDGEGTGYQHIIDSADLFDEGTTYYTFRLTVNGQTGSMNVYVTPTDQLSVIGHQLKVTTGAQETPAGQPDGIAIEVYGSAANPTNVCFDCLRMSSSEVIPNYRPIANPGLDQTSTLYKYAAFDGRASYDPEGSQLRYWWTITGAPENSELWVTGIGSTPPDASGYANVINGAAGDFDDVNVGDLLFLEDQYSTIKYIHSDTSYAVVVDHVFTASVSSASWSALKQSAWEGTWSDTSVVTVLDYTNTEPLGPSVNDTYLIGDNPIGNPTWVVGDAGKLAVWNGLSWTITAQTLGTIVFSIADVMNYRLIDTGPYDWVEDDPEPWELAHWSGRIFEIGTMLPDTAGLYTVELVVNDSTSMILPPKSASIDGSLNSTPAEVILNVSPTGAPLGIVPDMSFIWDYLSNFWSLPSGSEMMNTVWGAAAQILAGDMLELWQHDYAKGLFDIQRLFQRRWLGYDFFYEEPNFDDSYYQADIDVSVNLTGYSASPGLNDYSYDLGTAADPTIQSGHMLVLNGQSYEIARTAGDIVITRDVLPSTTNARVYANNATATFSQGETITGGTSGSQATVLTGGWNYLELDSPTGAFTTGETITGSSSGATATVTGYTPAYNQRPRYWQIRPMVTSKSTDFTLQVASMADTALFDIEDTTTNDRVRVGCYVYASRGSKLSFDDTSLTSYLADPDRYTVRFYGLVRRNYIPVDDLVLDMSSLQEVVDVDNVEDAPSVLIGNNDFIVETLTQVDDREVQVVNLLESYMERKDYGFDGDTSTTPSGKYFDSASSDFTASLGDVGTDLSNYLLWVNGEQYRLSSVTSATRLELADTALTTGDSNLQWRVFECGDPPDTSWAEITYLDNRPTVEANFGSRVGFTLDDWEQRTDGLDYLSAVQGLWYASWNGPTVSNIQTACQVLLGLPFAEAAGTITDIRTPFNTAQNRILIQDDGDEVIVRSYKFPVDLDVATNPDTDVTYQVGDHVEQFASLCTGVVVEDYISNPTWMDAVVGSGDLHEAQKVHTFGVTIDSSAFNATNILYMISYIIQLSSSDTPKVKPHYTHPMFIVIHEEEDTIDVEDAIVYGPAYPPETSTPGVYYTYPFTASWRSNLETPIPGGWSDSPAYPPSDNWEYTVPYDSSTRWPNDRFTNVPPRFVDYGGLHLEDTPGRVPDSWSGSWPQVPAPLAGGTHSSTPAEGTFRYGDTDEAGHYIHVYGTSETNVLLDADMESGDDPGVGGSPWVLANYGGSSHTLTAVKSGAQVHGGSQSTNISSIGPSQGIEQSFTTTVGYQVAATAWIYMVSGQAHLELYDGATQVAEWRLVSPVGSWTEIVLHHWSAANTTCTFRILTGPTGGDFYVDDVGGYSDAVPWNQWGYGRMYIGRTGGYTFGGSPDEDLEFTLRT